MLETKRVVYGRTSRVEAGVEHARAERRWWFEMRRESREGRVHIQRASEADGQTSGTDLGVKGREDTANLSGRQANKIGRAHV